MEFHNVIGTDESGGQFDWQEYITGWDFSANYTTGAVALLPGGWLPSIFAGGDHMLMPDRNVISGLRNARALLDQGQPKETLSLLLNEPIHLNPLAFVMEGNKRRPPNAVEIIEQVDEAMTKVADAFPNAILHPDRDSAIKGVGGLWSDMRESHSRSVDFLVAIYPFIAPSQGERRRKTIARLRAVADDVGLPYISFPFLAAWLAATLPQGKNPAFGLLKTGKTKKDGVVMPAAENAYNALADLRLMQLLVAGNVMFPDRPSALLSSDRDLAKLWVGLGVHNARLEGRAFHFSINMGPTSPFFAGLHESEVEIFRTG